MRPQGSARELEARRRRAVGLLRAGWGIREVARQVGSSPSSVVRWKDEVEKGGLRALKAKPHPGRPARMSPAERERLLELLLRGPGAHGFQSDLWTLPRVAAVILRSFGVHYHPAHVWKILRASGWSSQKPARRSRERDEGAIERWRRRRWPHIKKRPRVRS